jgi:hypothetical protein
MYRYIFLILLSGWAKAQTLTDLKTVLDAQKGQPVIEIPAGKYSLNNNANGAYQFINLQDVVINGNGAQIICNSQELAFRFLNCKRVKVLNLSVDYDPLCFTQGSIVAMATDKSWFEVEIDSGYAVENVRNERVQFYDAATRALKQNSITTGAGHYSQFQRIAGTRRFKAVKKGTWTAGEQMGDLVVFDVVSTKANPAAHCIFLEKCEDMEVKHVTVYGSNSFSFYERECSNTHYDSCRVDRGPSLPGIAARLRSGNADGIHSSHARKGPLVENCEVRHQGDDCIIVCGRSFPICRIDSASHSFFVLSRELNPVFATGDEIQHVLYSGVKNGRLTIQAIAPYTPTLAEQQLIQAKYPTLLSNDKYTRGARITVAAIPDSMGIGDVIYNEDATGSGFVIRNNKVGFNRSRGILIKSKNGLVENNQISGCAMNGILVAPEIHWMGGGFADSVEIRNNVISGCMFERTNTGMPPGVLSVFYANGMLDVPRAGAFTEINVHDNTIQQCPYPGIVFTSVIRLSQANNTVVPDPGNVREHGKRFGVTFNTPVWEKNNINK